MITRLVTSVITSPRSSNNRKYWWLFHELGKLLRDATRSQKPLSQILFHSGTKTTHAVQDVSIGVNSGETLGLVGESGCGKTTLSRCILHLEKPTSGAVIFDGVDISNLKGAPLKTMRREMQIVFQDPLCLTRPALDYWTDTG